MGVAANNFVVKGNHSVILPDKKEKTVTKATKTETNVDQPSKVVDGKSRVITKQSAYLLDMLSTDE